MKNLNNKNFSKKSILPIKRRILEYLESKGESKKSCYEKTQITEGILSQRGGISEENLLKFLSFYKDINKEWLLTGRGSMIISNLFPQKDPDFRESQIKYYSKHQSKHQILINQVKQLLDEQQKKISVLLEELEREV